MLTVPVENIVYNERLRGVLIDYAKLRPVYCHVNFGGIVAIRECYQENDHWCCNTCIYTNPNPQKEKS
jgi:hypothetical protein